MDDNELLKLATRLLWVLHNSPYEMNAKVTFINGVHHGRVEWHDPAGREYKRRWVHQTMQAVVSEFTADVMAGIYGLEAVYVPETGRDEPIVIQYEWNDYPKTFYFGFPTARQHRKWMDVHGGWLTWAPLRGLR